MPYKLYDINQRQVTHHDLQDKGMWCQSGATKEEVFVKKYGAQLNLIINPEKQTNPYVPDLLNISNNTLADLKTQNTPFFQARSRFGLDPQYVVVFNQKDQLRYQKLYPDIEIYFAIDWQVIKFEGYRTINVKPMLGIYFIPFGKLNALCQKAPLHSYTQRENDQKGNAKGSYVLDVREECFTKVL